MLHFVLRRCRKRSAAGDARSFNTDQGVQFTGEAFTNVLQASGIQISMDGRGHWADNVFIERVCAL